MLRTLQERVIERVGGLNVIQVEVPPLRERGEDIEILAAHFLTKHCRDLGRNPVSLTAAAGGRRAGEVRAR